MISVYKTLLYGYIKVSMINNPAFLLLRKTYYFLEIFDILTLNFILFVVHSYALLLELQPLMHGVFHS